ncbi:hypothetical protein Btru_012414 [Bulinus truncatus]|nr:hypothetical protein Btru_012414 [Bulinus truncatus]
MFASPERQSFKSASSIIKKPEGGDNSTRRKRQTIATYYIDVTAVLDYSRYSQFLDDASLNETVTGTKIQRVLRFLYLVGLTSFIKILQPTMSVCVSILNKVLIFKTSASFFELVYMSNVSAVTGKVDTGTVLSNLTKFLSSAAGRDFSFPYDHAMLFVGSDLWNGDTNILGLAWVKTLCRSDGYSSSVIEDKGDYSAIMTGAHELGHSLASYHDGEGNNCTFDDGYLMASSNSAPTDSTRQHPWRFSNCSVSYILTFITSLASTTSGQTCLSDALAVVGDFPDVSNRLLGQLYPADKQCQFKYGGSSYKCKIKYSSAEICYIYCSKPQDIYCYGQQALSGTTCGCGQVCKQGECVIDFSVSTNGCDIFTNCTMQMCQDTNLSRYCPYTCPPNVSSPSDTSTTPKTTLIANGTTTPTTTSATTPKTTLIANRTTTPTTTSATTPTTTLNTTLRTATSATLRTTSKTSTTPSTRTPIATSTSGSQTISNMLGLPFRNQKTCAIRHKYAHGDVSLVHQDLLTTAEKYCELGDVVGQCVIATLHLTVCMISADRPVDPLLSSHHNE